jgi:hypothetical protein
MMPNNLEENANQAVEEILSNQGPQFESRVEVIPSDFTVLVYIRLPEQDSPLEILRQNKESRQKSLSAPVVIDPKTGFLSHRYVIPYMIYKHRGVEKTLRLVLAARDGINKVKTDWSKLRSNKKIAEDIIDFQYGRSGRLSLLLERWPALLTAQVFPGGLVESDFTATSERLSSIAWILLARSGLANRPYSFHMIRDKTFLSVERASEIHFSISPDRLRSLEKDLVKQAEEDRIIIMALMKPSVPLSCLMRL